MKPFTRLFETIIGLLKKSLDEKWYPNNNTDELSDDCPFCLHARQRRPKFGKICQMCFCPDSICSPDQNGFVFELMDRYTQECLVSEIDQQDLFEMQAIFHNEIEALERELNL